jgi:hypothetical protein
MEVFMTFANLLDITPNPVLSFLIWILLALFALYLARKPFHKSVMSFSRIIRNAMRLTATSLLLAEKNLAKRNREVLMASGLDHAERVVEREFDRVKTAVSRNLEACPKVNRGLSEIIHKLEEDYKKSEDVPPALPNWMPIIDSISKIKHSGDSMVSNMLTEINKSLNDQHSSAIETYRVDMSKRHSILNKMAAPWQQILKFLGDINRSIGNLTDRAKRIDKYMDDYEKIRKKEDSAARTLSSSSLTQFFISGFVLIIAFGGALINFNLIALPMSEMVGGASYIGPYKTSDVAGLVIILVELTMGLFLLESLRITRLFPVIGSMDDKMRIRMIWVTFTMLTILAGVESALAFMRDRIALDVEALRQTLAGVEQTQLATSLIPTIGQMVMGFILPFALAFVGIPLESFVSSARTVLGVVVGGLLRITAFALRLLGNIVFYSGRCIVNIYDILIFPPIWLENIVLGSKGSKSSKSRKKASKDKQGKIEVMDREDMATENLD